MGDKFDTAKGDGLPAGGFTYMDAMGPFAIVYIDPKDDPSKVKK